MTMLIHGVTPRGFDYLAFTDWAEAACKLQHSSWAEDEAIWFGRDTGPRMHLERDRIAALLPYLARFAEGRALLDPAASPEPRGAVALYEGRTALGSAMVRFRDAYGRECKLQEAQQRLDEAIWLGPETGPLMFIGRGLATALVAALARFAEEGTLRP